MKQFLSISGHGFGRLATSGALAAGLAWVAAPVRAEVAEPINPSSGNYYYAGGQKYVLPPSGDWVGVQVEPNTSNALVKGVQSEAALDEDRKPVRVGKGNLLLLPVDQDAQPEKKRKLKTRLRRSTKVRRVLRTWSGMGGGLPFIDTGQFVVRFKPGITRAQAQQILAQRGAVLEGSLGAIAPNGYVARVRNPQTTSALVVSAALQESGQTVFSHPNFLMPLVKYATPNDPLFPQQWHLNNNGQASGKVAADVRALQAWDITTGDPSITIAIMDDAVDTDHEDFGATKLVPGYDFLDDDNDPRPQEIDDDHGTACAGVATATGNNGIGVTGIAQNCKLMPIRMLAPFVTPLQIANAFRFAASNGADVISNSWGASAPRPLNDLEKAAMDFATTSGRGGKGCVILFAAGNSSRSQDRDGRQSYDRVISVAASTNRDLRSFYSNFGRTVDITAPSNGGTLGIVTTDRMGTPGYDNTNYSYDFGGTSSACPLVAGVVGLLLSVEPELTYTEVRERLTQTADKIDPAGGLYDAEGHSLLYGFGRVNAFRALQGRPPATTLVSPVDNAQITGAVSLKARTTNDSKVTRVEFEARQIVASAKSKVPLNRPIPDFDPAGLRDELIIVGAPQSATVEANVSVEIDHPYIGDLEVNLISPDGSRENIYDHSGGSADKLVLNRALALKSRPVTGTYAIEVIDDAQEDTGTLISWSLTFTGPWVKVGVDSDGPTAGLWTATWNAGSTLSGKYEVRANAITINSGVFTDTNTDITLKGSAASTFAISGRVTDSAEKPVANVPVSRGSVTVKTNANGEYTFTGVTAGTYSIAPTQVGGIFTPTARNVTVGSASAPNATGVNFTRTASDLIAPTLVVTKPANPGIGEPRSSYVTLTGASGTAADTGGSGLLKVTGLLTRAGGGGVLPGYYAGGGVFDATFDAVKHELLAKGTTNWTFAFPSLPEGRYTFRATAYDKANNIKRSDVITFFIDRSAPTVTIERPLANKAYTLGSLTSANGTAKDANGGSILSVTGLLYRYANGTVPAGYWNGRTFTATYKPEVNEVLATGTSTWSFLFPRSLPDGRYTFRATARDRAGNVGKSATVIFSIRSATAPTSTASSVFSAASASAAQSTLTLVFSTPLGVEASDAANYVVSVNGVAVSVESADVAGGKVTLGLPEAALSGGTSVAVTWAGLTNAQGKAIADGQSTVTVP